MDARGAIAVAERQSYIGRVRDLCKSCDLCERRVRSSGCEQSDGQATCLIHLVGEGGPEGASSGVPRA